MKSIFLETYGFIVGVAQKLRNQEMFESNMLVIYDALEMCNKKAFCSEENLEAIPS